MSENSQPTDKTYYARWSSRFRGESNPLLALEQQVLPQLWGDVGELSVAVIGCHIEPTALGLTKLGARVEAVEFSRAAARKVSRLQRYKKVNFQCQPPGTRLSFADNQFDGVLINRAIELFDNPGDLLQEAARITGPGGFLILSELHPMLRVKDAQSDFYEAKIKQKIALPSPPYTTRDLVKQARKNGLKIIHIKEHSTTEDIVTRYPETENYDGWPILFTMQLIV